MRRYGVSNHSTGSGFGGAMANILRKTHLHQRYPWQRCAQKGCNKYVPMTRISTERYCSNFCMHKSYRDRHKKPLKAWRGVRRAGL